MNEKCTFICASACFLVAFEDHQESSMISKVVYCKPKLKHQHTKTNIFLVIMSDSF